MIEQRRMGTHMVIIGVGICDTPSPMPAWPPCEARVISIYHLADPSILQDEYIILTVTTATFPSKGGVSCKEKFRYVKNPDIYTSGFVQAQSSF
jgi:hypothetical protein